jgi:hypothetical protein
MIPPVSVGIAQGTLAPWAPAQALFAFMAALILSEKMILLEI